MTTPTARIVQSDLRDLASWSQGPCVSIYIPVGRDPRQLEADRLALRSIVREAGLDLERQAALDRAAIDEMLAPARAMIDGLQPDRLRRGYGLFAAPGTWRRIELAVDTAPLWFVADRFVVTPLVADLHPDHHYYLLAVSQNQIRFFRGDREGLVQVDVPGLPASRAEALWYEDNERSINVHGGSRHGAGQIVGTVHGSPSDRDLRKQQVLRFFRAVDKALTGVLHAESAPLLLAGVGYELAIYSDANHYPHLAGRVEIGNPERLDAATLHEATWPTAATALDSTRRDLILRAASSAAQLTTVAAILAAYREGRVEALLVRPDSLLWGRLVDGVGHLEPRPGDIELISAVIGAALEQGASVFPLAPGELPFDPPVAAVARF